MQNNTDTCANNSNNNTPMIIQSLSLFFSVISTAIGAFGAFQWKKMTAHKTTSAEDMISLKCNKLKLTNEKMGFEAEGLEAHIQERDSGSKSVSKQSATVVAKNNIRQESLLFASRDEGSKTQSLSSPTVPEHVLRLDTKIIEQENNGITRQGPADTKIVRDAFSAITNIFTSVLYSAVVSEPEPNQPISSINNDVAQQVPSLTPLSPQPSAHTVAYASPPINNNNNSPVIDSTRYGYSYPSHMSLSATSCNETAYTTAAISKHTVAIHVNEGNEPYPSPSLSGENTEYE